MSARSRDQFVSRVVANVPLCREHYRLVLRVDGFPPTEPGQFVQVSCRDLGRSDHGEVERVWSVGQPAPSAHDPGDHRPPDVGLELEAPQAFLRRPFSLAGRVDWPDGSVELHLIQRVVGVGTDWLGKLRPGDAVHLLGPLGNRFTLPPVGGRAVLVGGGVGIPPMLYLAEKLAGRDAVAFAGALTRDLLPLTISDDDPPRGGNDSVEPRLNVGEFARHSVRAVLTTDDGSYGFRGFVTQALEQYLDRLLAGAASGGAGGPGGKGAGEQGSKADATMAAESSGDRSGAVRAAPLHPFSPPPYLVIYTCGPEPMMRRVADIAAARGIECQVAVERAMACGMGTCQSCCIRVRKPDPAAVPLPGKDWCWRLACTDGPVFRGADLLW